MWPLAIFFGTRHQAARNITHIGELNEIIKDIFIRLITCSSQCLHIFQWLRTTIPDTDSSGQKFIYWF